MIVNNKINIITLHAVKNYGSVLQTYATQKKMEQFGYIVEFADYWRKDNIDEQLTNEYLKYSEKWNSNCFKRCVYKAVKTPSIRKRISTFNSFLKDNIHLTERRYYTLEELQAEVPQADIYCTGSDQMWNSDWNNGIEKPFFLEYAPAGKKRIAYSSSFGKPKLDEWEKEETKRILKKYNAISVREASGVDILDDLGIEGGVNLLDPTLVLNNEDWKGLIAERQIKQKYVLIYQLNNNKDFDKYAKVFARQKGLKLVRLAYDYDQVLKSGWLICCPKVEVFLSLFYNAEYIITDSFHGTAFSINFNKKFAVVYPPKFSTRLQSVLELTGLTKHVLNDFNNYTIPDLPVDYGKVNRILDAERKKADDFLKTALSIDHVLTGDAQ
jgi:hypothetical protein